MKILVAITLFVLLASTKESCKDKTNAEANVAGCYKGRLEVKGGCMNYTIGVLSSNMDTALIVAHWTDESTHKAYKNVFGLMSRCTFPDSINAGDEFYFVIDSTSVQHCNVCLMYYPVPPKRLSIKVITGPCRP